MIRVPRPGALSTLSEPPSEAALAAMFSSPRCPAPPVAAGSKPRPLSATSSARAVFFRTEPDADAGRTRAPGRARQRLSHDVEQPSAGVGQQLGGPIGDGEVHLYHRVEPELFDERRHATHEVGPLEELRAESEDEVPDVADRNIERVDRPIDPGDAHLTKGSLRSMGTADSWSERTRPSGRVVPLPGEADRGVPSDTWPIWKGPVGTFPGRPI